MFYQKQGMPQEGENVVCTVTKIHSHSVFVSLNEFRGKSGLLHISEISPGRVRNIREYVKEGKVIVCKVLKIDQQKGHIDLSLRRVSENQRIQKMSLIKQEQKAEKIIENAATELKVEFRKLYDKIAKEVFKNYDYIYDFFFETVVGDAKISDIGLTDAEIKAIEPLVQQRIKKAMVELDGKLKLVSHAGDGVEQVKKVLVNVDKVDERLVVRYMGAGVFRLSVSCEEFKEAEDIMKKALGIVEKAVDNKTMQYEWTKEEGKKVEE